jgi:hypothetical protein
VYGQGTRGDQVDLGYRQIIAFAMRHFADMPKEPVKEDRVMQPAPMADRAVLRRFADLADQLGFSSIRIKHLRRYPAAVALQTPPSEHPPLVTSGSGVKVAQRCGIPLRLKFKEDREFWFINHLHDERQQQGKGVTRFFVRKHVYLAFFGRPTWRPTVQGAGNDRSPSFSSTSDLGDLPPTKEDMVLFVQQSGPSQTEAEGTGNGGRPGHPTNREEFESRQDEHERRRRKKLERKKRREARQEKERLEKARLERERQEKERREKERQEREQLERAQQRERLEKEQLEREQEARLETERLEQLKRRININLFRWEDDSWKYLTPLTVDPQNPSNVEQLVNDYMTRGVRALNTNLRMMSPEEYFQAIINDRTHTILLITEYELVLDDRMLESAAKLHEEAIKRVIGLKRTATDDLSH